MKDHICSRCAFWRREWTWQAGVGKTLKKYGECSNERFYEAFSVNEEGALLKLATQFPTAKPNEDFGCIFWKEISDEKKEAS